MRVAPSFILGAVVGTTFFFGTVQQTIWDRRLAQRAKLDTLIHTTNRDLLSAAPGTVLVPMVILTTLTPRLGCSLFRHRKCRPLQSK